jgi:preprotein translocase subunit SecD
VLAVVAMVGVTERAASSAEHGGLTIVLTSAGRYDPERFDKSLDAIEYRVDFFRKKGVLDVEDASVKRRGHDIVVRLSGVKHPSRAQRLIVPTPLYFRPVLARVPLQTDSVPDELAAKAAIASCDPAAIQALRVIPTTEPSEDDPDQCVVFATRDEQRLKYRLLLGPAELAGNEDVVRARSRFQRGYVVLVTLRKDGLAKFNALAAKAYGRPSPADEVALVLGGVVESNPAFQAPRFDGIIQISGNFSKPDADELARAITYGAFPVTLKSVTPT